MPALLTSIGQVGTSIITEGGKIVTFVTENPLLLIPVALTFFGMGIGLVKSFAR